MQAHKTYQSELLACNPTILRPLPAQVSQQRHGTGASGEALGTLSPEIGTTKTLTVTVAIRGSGSHRYI